MEKDKDLQKILQEKEIPEPSEKLEERIMLDIYSIISHKASGQKYLKLAWVFFTIGLITGIFLTTLLIDNKENVQGTILSSKVLIQSFCIIILLLLFERLYNATIEKKT
jgi:hypothetical protein